MNKREKENFKKILQDSGLKRTTPRLAVLKALSEFRYPETAKEIHKRLRKENVDLVTLYRTLALFEKSQLIQRVDLHTDAVYYELNRDHHHHIICTNCKKLEDFKLCDVDYLIKKITSQASNFKKALNHNLEVFGICNTCAKI